MLIYAPTLSQQCSHHIALIRNNRISLFILDDNFLLAFLRYAKYNHLKAQTRLDKFCTFRTSSIEGFPEWFKDTPQRRQNWEKWLEMK